MYYYLTNQQRTGKRKISIRTFPAIEAIPEAIGRCAEMGTPLFFYTGWSRGSISNPVAGPMLMAGINVLGYTTRLCINRGVQPIYFNEVADSLSFAEDTLRSAYRMENKSEEYDPNMIIYQPGQGPMLSTYMSMLEEKKPGACLVIGSPSYETIILGEAGKVVGAMQIGGTANINQLAFMIATMDYALINEEIYAVSAAISNDVDNLACIAAEDILKVFLLALIAIGFSLAFARIPWIINFLGV